MKLDETTMEVSGVASAFPQLRPLASEVALLSRPDGSACFNQGDTSVMAAVYGPAEVRINKEIINKATIEVVYKPKSGLPGCVDRFSERLVCNTCHTAILATLHPRTSINIIIQEMQNSGSFLACCINAACMSLLDAGIPMKYTVAAVSCVIDSKGDIILDPTIKQERGMVASLLFTFDSKDINIVTSSSKGSYTNEQFQQCLAACKEASKTIFTFYKDTMKKKLLKSV